MGRTYEVVPGTPREPPEHWPGDPGDGNYYVGWSLGPGNSTIAAARNNAGWPGDNKISVIHDYNPSGLTLNTSDLDDAINNGFIASQTFKLNTLTPAQIVAGNNDANLITSAQACIARAPWPIWLCYYHEPEDNFAPGTAADNYRAAYRHIVDIFDGEGVTNVSWHPILMNPFTFTNRDYKNWHPDWDGTNWITPSRIHAFGLDTYNPIPNGTANQTFPGMWGHVYNDLNASPVYPGPRDFIIPEFGMSYNVNPDPDWVVWATEARDYAKANNIKAFCYWDNSAEACRYSFGPTCDPTGNKLDGWNVIVNGSVKWGGV